MQRTILERLQAHVKLEKSLGAEVFPAMRKGRNNARFEQAEQREFFLATAILLSETDH